MVVFNLALIYVDLGPRQRRHEALHEGAVSLVDQPLRLRGDRVEQDGRVFSVMSFTVARGRIVEIDVLANPARLRRLGLAV